MFVPAQHGRGRRWLAQVLQPYRAIRTAGGQGLPIRTEGYGVDRILVPSQDMAEMRDAQDRP
jgi:hypothetical protein